MRTFALVALFSGLVVIGLLWLVGAKLGDHLTTREALAAGMTGWLMSTLGIGILIAGAKARPDATLNFCIAGMVAKLMVFAIAAAIVIGAGEALSIGLEPFLIAGLIAFLAVGMVQFGLAVKTLGAAMNVGPQKMDQIGSAADGQG